MNYIDVNEAKKRFTIKIQAKQHKLKTAPFWKRGRIKREIKALEEGQRDILNTSTTQTATTDSVVDENNYTSYVSQVETTYEMYNARKSYGSELLGALVDTRVNLICGEGMSVKVDGSPGAQKWADDFLIFNKLHGTRLMQQVQIGEMEGKNLVILKADKKDMNIKARSVPWRVKPYTVRVDEFDADIVKKILIKNKHTGEEEDLTSPASSVFARLGGSADNINETTNRIHRILTQVENYSRAAFDLRNNTHLFGRIMPYWKTETQQAAKAINNDVNNGNWEMGKGYAGMGDFSLIAPPSSGGDLIVKDMLTSLRAIGTMTGIPILFMNWPELMSNRSTAEVLYEALILATKKDRLIWEESYKKLIEKAQVIAIDKLGVSNEILADVTVKLPIISASQLKLIVDLWLPLLDMQIVDKFTLQNMLPGIDPAQVNKRLEEERKENAANSVMQNGTVNNTLNNLKEKEE